MKLSHKRIKLMGLTLIFILVFSACDNKPKEKKPGQALVSINGHEVTTLQLNDEVRHAGVRADQYDDVSGKLLESLITRQLIVEEAIRNKLDRTPEVMQARERANSQIIARAYLQDIVNKVTKPSQSEIDEYFQKHPEYFVQRKQFDMTILRIAAKDFNEKLKVIIDNAKSIDEVTAWLDKHNVHYSSNLTSRSNADLPPEMVTKILEDYKNNIFIVNERDSYLLISVTKIKDSPITAAAAAAQIEKYLTNLKYKQATDAEIARLRSAAKIEYLNVKAPVLSTEKSATQSGMAADSITENPSLSDPVSEGSIERGIMGLK